MIQLVHQIVLLNNNSKPKQHTVKVQHKSNSNFSIVLNEQLALCKSSNS